MRRQCSRSSSKRASSGARRARASSSTDGPLSDRECRRWASVLARGARECRRSRGVGTPGGGRTRAGPGLSRLPLPLGYGGDFILPPAPEVQGGGSLKSNPVATPHPEHDPDEPDEPDEPESPSAPDNGANAPTRMVPSV